MSSFAFPLAALLPLIIGPLPAEAMSLTATLCASGETIVLTLPMRTGGEDEPGACLQKGCHAGCSRKRLDRSQ